VTSVNDNESEEEVIFDAARLLTVPGGGPLLTVTLTAAEIVVLAAASLAEAVKLWAALVAVVLSQMIAKGAVVSSAPRLTPSSLNCTPTTPTLSEALAVTETDEPETMAPALGAEIETVGGMVSGVAAVVKVKSAEVAKLAEASLDLTL
jgi:hypothetical protein